ncbi:MAG: glycoside hydrolase family 2 protein [Solirubrobacteraceae bacterium]
MTRARVSAHDVHRLEQGWQAVPCAPDFAAVPSELEGLQWQDARVPGTAAGALADAGLWQVGDDRDFDAEDWWFRTRFEAEPVAAGERVLLCLDGIATVAEVYLNGELVLEIDSMFVAHQLDVGEKLAVSNELSIRCRALGPLLQPRRRPRARWRTRLVAEGNLRFFRTMLLGRAPGFAPRPAVVGPWRSVRLERRRRVEVEQLTLRPRLEGRDGVLTIDATLQILREPVPTSAVLELSRGEWSMRADVALAAADEDLSAECEMTVPDVEPWWPHTHGEPALYEARLLLEGDGEPLEIDLGRVGFRSLQAGASSDHDVLVDGLDLHINGVAVFARGALWTPLDAVGPVPSESELRAALKQVCEAGMNMLRIPGTAAYEQTSFYELCDELGLLVWQDFMFANLDYPIADEAFRASVEQEARQLLGRLAGRPCLTVLCGNSEIEQQVAMLGLDPSLGRGELFGELLPAIVGERDAQAIYIPSAPCGGTLPFRPDRGVANYYGVGGYRRDLSDVRLAEVRFAAECLAIANVPDEQAIAALAPESPGSIVVHHPRWKSGVPRDSGSGWDFDDVRDHYLALLHDVDPAELRRIDHERYLELSRSVSGEVMAEVFGEWRRTRSPCGGGLVLWLRDMLPGAGWGVVDHRGEAKVAYHHLRRALAPTAVWMTDEGLGGVRAHVANDRPTPLQASLRVACYRDGEHVVNEGSADVELLAHGAGEWDVEELIGHFVDASWAYRFGPPAQDVIVASLERSTESGPPELISQAFRFPAGRPRSIEAAGNIGLQARAEIGRDGTATLSVSTRKLAYGVRVLVPGHDAPDDAFSVEPGGERVLQLRRRDSEAQTGAGALSALNVRGRVQISWPADA